MRTKQYQGKAIRRREKTKEKNELNIKINKQCIRQHEEYYQESMPEGLFLNQ